MRGTSGPRHAGHDANKIFIENGKLHGALMAKEEVGRLR